MRRELLPLVLAREALNLKRNAEAGHALPLVALALAALMGFGGMAADVGYWRYQERQQQSATDAAAIGGAQQLLRSTCPNYAVANVGRTTGCDG